MELEPFVFRQAGAVVGWRSVSADEEGGGGMDAVLEAVNRHTLRPLEAEEFAVFRLDLCHNGVDRHFSRFPLEELERINALVPGRPLMERHDLRGSLPRGRFFRSSLHRDGERVSVRPDVYVLRTPENEGFIRNIEGGVYRETSIGFSFRVPECSVCGKDLRTCDHEPGRSYGGEVCHFIMRGVVDVVEGSVVAAGSQGTGFVARDHAALAPQEALEAARTAQHAPVMLECRELGVAPDDAAGLLRDGVAARRRAMARLCALGRELDGGAFDEAVWMRTLSGLGLDDLTEHLRGYEARFDEKYPPSPVSVAEPLPESEGDGRRTEAVDIALG